MIQPKDLGYSCPFSYQPINRFSITGGGDSAGSTWVVVKFLFDARLTPWAATSCS